MYAEKLTEVHVECERGKMAIIQSFWQEETGPLQEQRAVENLTESNRAGNSWTFLFWSLKHFVGLSDSECN